MPATKTASIRTQAQQEQDRILMLNWSKMSIPQLATLLRCEESTVHRRAKRLRGIGVALPERKRTNKAPAKEEVKLPSQDEKIVAAPRYWPDNWQIRPPSRSRLMAGR